MIKKLKWDEQSEDAAKEVQNLINQLVDAVNELTMEKSASVVGKVETPAENVQTDTESRPENVQSDLYAEQRKWIGKLCRFWDEKEEKAFGILTTIDSDCGLSDMCPYWNDTTKNWFEHCEPLKPDDDIIYKGQIK